MTSPRRRGGLPAARSGLSTAVGSLREAFRNDGIRRLATSWTLGIAADNALFVITLVTVFNRGGAVAAAVLGAIRMIPAVVAGMLTGAMLERFRGDRVLVVVGLVRAACAALTAVTILSAGPTMADHRVTMYALFVLATVAAAAGAPVRPTQVTLMPALARSPSELVAANTTWTTGEGFGAFVGPFLAGVLMASGNLAIVGWLAAVTFLATAAIALGLRFEQSADASGGGRRVGRGLRLVDGLREVSRSRVLAWTMLGTYGQVITRGLLNALVVVASIELLGMGQAGLGLLTAALGLGGLVGAIFAMSSRSGRLIRTEVVALVFWGLPLAVIGLVPNPAVALAAMVVIGVANATYDVALFTILQRACTNDARGPVLSVLEAVIGLGAISGSLLAPLLLGTFRAQGALIVGGVILPVIAFAMWLRIGRVRKIEVVNEELVDVLRAVPAFAELPLTAVERLAAGLVPVTFPAGIALMTQGEPGDRFIVIAAGEADAIVDGRTIHRVGPGDGVGEIALLRRSPRTATVLAVTNVSGYSVDAATFLAAIAGPAAAAVTERMAEANLRRASTSTESSLAVG